MTDFNRYPRERLLRLLSRRELFSRLGSGAGALALAALLGEQAQAETAQRATYDLLPKPPPLTPRAKRVIYLFQNGGPSQVDLFDPKPELNKRQGEKPGKGYVNDGDEKKKGVWLG